MDHFRRGLAVQQLRENCEKKPGIPTAPHPHPFPDPSLPEAPHRNFFTWNLHCSPDYSFPHPMAISPRALFQDFPPLPSTPPSSTLLQDPSVPGSKFEGNFYPGSPFPFIPNPPNSRGSRAQTILPPTPLYPQRASLSGRSPFCLQHVTDALATGLSSADLAAGACGREVQAEGHAQEPAPPPAQIPGAG